MSRQPRGVSPRTIILGTAFSLVAAGGFLWTQGLDQAAAWANIIALFVAIVGVGVGALPQPGAGAPARTDTSGPAASALEKNIAQTGVAYGGVINISGDRNQVRTRDRRR